MVPVPAQGVRPPATLLSLSAPARTAVVDALVVRHHALDVVRVRVVGVHPQEIAAERCGMPQKPPGACSANLAP